MNNLIKLEDPGNGKIKNLKSGWSWTCFFFCFTGIPLFNRGLMAHGYLMVALWISMFVVDNCVVYENCSTIPCFRFLADDLVALILTALSIFYSIKANKMGLAELQSQGWVIIHEPKA